MNRIVKWGIIALIVWWVIKDPAAASVAVRKLGNLATQAATSFATLAGSI